MGYNFPSSPSLGQVYQGFTWDGEKWDIPAASYQPLDADLTAIAALTGTNTIYYRSAANTWSPVNVSTGLAFAGGNLTCTLTGGNVSNSGTPVAGQLAQWTDATHIQGVDASTFIFNCGRLEFVSATALSFKPYNGDRIKINGVVYAIPSGGITGLANTGVFVNGVAGQNLVASTGYNIYAFNNAGTITADFSATGHGPSTTAGNVGTEIKTGDGSRTLIGKCIINSSAQFQDDVKTRFVLSWFNRRNRSLNGQDTAGLTTTSGGFVELSTNCRILFACWADEAVFVAMNGVCSNGAANGFCYCNIGLDGTSTTVLPTNSAAQSYAAGAQFAVSGGNAALPGEGSHFFTPLAAVSSSTGTFYIAVVAMIRG